MIKQLFECRDTVKVSKNIYNSMFQFEESVDLKGHKYVIQSITISKDNKILASGDQIGKIILWDIEKQEKMKEFQSEKGTSIQKLKFSQDSLLLAVSYYKLLKSCDIIIFQLQTSTRRPMFKLSFGNDIVQDFQFTRDSKHLLSVTTEYLIIWNLGQPSTFKKYKATAMLGLFISENQNLITCWSQKGQVFIFSISKNNDQIKFVDKWQLSTIYMAGTIFTQKVQQMITCANEIKIWSLFQHKLLRILKLDYFIWRAQFIHNQNILIINQKHLTFWNLQTNELINNFVGKDNCEFIMFAATSDGKYIVSLDNLERLIIYITNNHQSN